MQAVALEQRLKPAHQESFPELDLAVSVRPILGPPISIGEVHGDDSPNWSLGSQEVHNRGTDSSRIEV